MKVHRFLSINMTATFDTAYLKRSISTMLPEMEVELKKLVFVGKIIHVKNLFRGEIASIGDVVYRIPCSINCFLFLEFRSNANI